jgi:hypothetical protein
MFGNEINYRGWRILPRRESNGSWAVYYYINQREENFIRGCATADEAIEAAKQAVDNLI